MESQGSVCQMLDASAAQVMWGPSSVLVHTGEGFQQGTDKGALPCPQSALAKPCGHILGRAAGFRIWGCRKEAAPRPGSINE